MRIEAQIDPTPKGCRATCRRCGHTASASRAQPGEVLGKRQLHALALADLQATCPRGEFNRYVRREVPLGLELRWIDPSGRRLPAWVEGRRVTTAIGRIAEHVVIEVCPTSFALRPDATEYVIELLRHGYENARLGPEEPPFAPPPSLQPEFGRRS